MKKNRLIFYIIFSTFHLFLFGFSLYVDKHGSDISFLLGLQKKIWMLKYGSFLGLVLLTIDLFWDRHVMKTHKKEKDQLQNELNALKAKLYDKQQGSSSTINQEKTKQSQTH